LSWQSGILGKKIVGNAGSQFIGDDGTSRNRNLFGIVEFSEIIFSSFQKCPKTRFRQLLSVFSLFFSIKRFQKSERIAY
jgi:hypothetical protein